MRRTSALLAARRALIAAPLLIAALTAGCGQRNADKAAIGRGQSLEYAATSPAADASAVPSSAPAREMVAEGGGGTAASGALEPAATLGRMLIRNISLTLVVADVDSAGARVERLVASRGGFVSWSQMDASRGLPWRHYTLRIPTDRLDATIADLHRLAVKVSDETRQVQDVTEQAVDVQARLRTLRATEEELIGLLKDARTRGQKAEDVMAIYRELTGIRTQIEQYQGQLQSLQSLAALSTVSLQLMPDAATGPIQSHGWRPGETVRNSLRQLVGALRGLGDFAIWAAIVLLPILLLAGLAIALIVQLVKRVGFRRGRAERD